MNLCSTAQTSPSNARRVLLPLQMTEPATLPESCKLFQADGLSMGTTWNVKAWINLEQSEPELVRGIQRELDLVVAQMSPWKANSELSRFNRAAAGTWQQIPNEFMQVLAHALFVAEQTQGAYDPSIGHLANLWGFGPKGKIEQCPTESEIQEARQLTAWQRLKLDKQQARLYQAGNMQLDLCSTAKGFGVDQVARYLQTQGIVSYLVEVGGELRGLGMKPDQQPWWVEIDHDTLQNDGIETASTVIALHGLSIATSGDQHRYFDFQGKRYSHTIDPRSGYPVTHQVTSVTVIHPECMIADALATAISVLGLEQGMAYAKQLHVATRIVLHDAPGLQEHFSPAMLAMMEDDD